jgi:hypothetical protein
MVSAVDPAVQQLLVITIRPLGLAAATDSRVRPASAAEA